MKILELFENEDNTEYSDFVHEIEPIIPFLKRNKRALLDGHFLYRGIKFRAGILHKFTRLDSPRSPKDLTERQHGSFAKFMLQTFGFDYRSYTKFATGDRDEAMGYGHLYLIFPIGDYDLCYSPKVKDPYGDFFVAANIFINFGLGLYKGDYKAWGEALMKYNLLTEEQFKFSITSEARGEPNSSVYFTLYEIVNNIRMFSGPDDEDEQNFENFLLNEFFPKCEYTVTDDYTEASGSRKEVMIKCKEYMLISSNFERHLTSFLKTL